MAPLALPSLQSPDDLVTTTSGIPEIWKHTLHNGGKGLWVSSTDTVRHDADTFSPVYWSGDTFAVCIVLDLGSYPKSPSFHFKSYIQVSRCSLDTSIYL